MPEQLYNKYADLTALQKQTETILKMFATVEAGVVKLKDLGININAEKSVKGVKGLTDEFDKQNATIKKQQQELINMKQKLAELTTQEAKEIEAVKQVTNLVKQRNAEEIKSQTIRQAEYTDLQKTRVANAQVAKDIQLRIKLNQAVAGSEEQLALQYEKAQRILKRAAPAQRDSQRGQDLAKFAAETKKQLDALQQKVGNFKGNVGNYTKSLEGLFTGVANEIKRLKAEQDKINQRTIVQGFVSPKDQAELDKATNAITELNSVMAISEKTGQSFQKTVKAIGFEFSNLSSSGNQDIAFLKEFKAGAGEAKDAAQDLKDELKAASSDTRKFDLIAGAVSGLVSVAQTAVGAMALFGHENEDVQKSIQKLVALQSVANGVQEIARQLTDKTTAAYKAMNFVVSNVGTAFGKGATGAQKFGAALKLTGVGLLITLIAVLIDKFNLFGGATAKAVTAEEKFRIQLDLTNKELERQNLALDRATQLRIERAKARGATELQLSGLTIAALAKRGRAEKDLADKQLASIKYATDGYRQFVTDVASADKAIAFFTSNFSEGKEKEIAALESAKTHLQNYEDTRFQIEQTNAQNSTRTAEKRKADLDKAGEDTKEAIEREKKAQYDLFVFEQNLIKEKADMRANDVDESAPIRLAALEASQQAQLAIVERTKKEKLRQEKLTTTELLLIDAEYKADKIKVAEETSKRVTDILVEENQRRRAIAQKVLNEHVEEEKTKTDIAIAQSQTRFDREIAKLERAKQQELQIESEKRAKGITTAGQYAQKKLEIETRYQQQVLIEQIKFFDSQLLILEAGSKEYIEMQTKIAAARAALNDSLAAVGVDLKDKTKEQLEEIQKNYYETFKNIADTISNVLGGIAERRKQQIQEEIDLIEERKAREIDAVSASSESEEKKAARIKIIEAKAQSDREALEKRQRQIDRQRAIAERAFKGFQVVTDTIMAVAKIKAAAAVAFANAMALPPPFGPLIAAGIKTAILSQIPLTITSGAAALTAILAAPLPKLATGTKSSKEGFHEIGERGRELAVSPDGKIKMYTKPTVDYLKKGTRVFNNKETETTLKAINNINNYLNVKDKSTVSKSTVEDNIKVVNQFINTKNIKLELLSYDSVSRQTESSVKILRIINDLIKNTTKINVIDEVIKTSKITDVDKTRTIESVKRVKRQLPGFYQGTENSPEGYARVAEKGREIGVEKSGRVVLWDKPSIAYLRSGTKILNNKVTEDIINNTKIDLINRDDRVLHQDSDFSEQILKELQKKKQPNVYIYNNQNIESTFYYQQQIKH